MAKAKKTKEKVEEVLQPTEGTIQLAEPKRLKDCEWCFQFDDDKPQVFAWTDDEMDTNEDPKILFSITNTENSYINFTNGESGKRFKIFARELSEEGRTQRDKQKESLKNLENGSENKEA